LGQLGAAAALGFDGGGNSAHDGGRRAASPVAENGVRQWR